ncbi:MAG TPA: hypothetical protein VNY05_42235 [Candidatus Acidoferrales bacterium]|nr:hypothetical protein [Candidatus Acidoferrales bacterium]
MNCYSIVKQTATHADTLAAIGAADMFRHLEPRIVELEDRFEIRFPRGLKSSDVDAVDPGFSYLLRPGKRPPNLPPERTIEIPPAGRGADGDPDRMYRILSRMKAYAGPNKIVMQFARLSRAEWSRRIWDCAGGGRRFVPSSPLVQLFNPQSAMGYALLKPNGTRRRDKTKDAWGNSFLEWLRYRGYFEGAAGWFTAGDLRLYCPIPAQIPFDELAAAAASLRAVRLGGSAVKMDCRAVLGLTRILIERGRPYRRPAESIRGIWVTHYKDMGQAHTVMATQQLALPDWFGLGSDRQEALWLRTIEEHEMVVRRLTDTHSDEFALLKQYRRTFQARREDSIREFVTFLAEYGQVLFRLRTQDQWTLSQFKLETVTPILGRDAGLRGWLHSRGFRAVSAAIRASTLGAQALRNQGRLDFREVRYGWLADIRRTGPVGREALLKQHRGVYRGVQCGDRTQTLSGNPRAENPGQRVGRVSTPDGRSTWGPGARRPARRPGGVYSLPRRSRAPEMEAERIMTA